MHPLLRILRAAFSRQSWKRRDEDRRRRKGDLEPDGEPDWSDPNVWRFYGGGEAGGVEPEILSPRLLDLPRRFAQPGEREFGALIDRETGEVLQMVKGGRSTLRFDPEILDSRADIVAVHTHDEDSGFSDADWRSFTLSDNANLEMLVTPEAIYIMVKKEGQYDPAPASLGQESVAG